MTSPGHPKGQARQLQGSSGQPEQPFAALLDANVLHSYPTKTQY
jgi:hypothetical protein